MADCRKCGSKKLTRRRAGEFFCQHCGMQPGVLRMDRLGNVTPKPVEKEGPKP
jgi:ribosomal protein L37AE/L43A